MNGTIGEIRLFAGNFAPRNWAFCNGNLLEVDQYTALFSILGTTYGGNGRTNFALPDLRGRGALHEGTGPSLSTRRLGEKGGAETVTLNENQIPSHTHTATAIVNADGNAASTNTPSGNVWASPTEDVNGFGSGQTTTLADGAVTVTNAETGGDDSHDNMPPYQVSRYIICLEGIYPNRG